MLRKWLLRRRLAKTMKPDASYWERRLRAMSPERRVYVEMNKVLP